MQLSYFGTDGIRGTFNTHPITESFFHQLGVTLAHFIAQNPSSTPYGCVIGHDTRTSCELLAHALIKGLLEYGIEVTHLGIVPTAAVVLHVQELDAHMGFMITASHNPATDNGIKLFDGQGFKLTQKTEQSIEHLLNDSHSEQPSPNAQHLLSHTKGSDLYIKTLLEQFSHLDLSSFKIILDTANGATVQTSAAVLKALGANLIHVGASLDGTRINQNVGSEHPEYLKQLVRNHQAHIGIAHDGDGDRLVVCDETGTLLSGEAILGILALQAQQKDALPGNLLVTTLQSNLGFDHSLKAHGIQVLRTDIGDRNIVHKMLETGASLGGESSGHFICRDILNTGDGLTAALKLLEAIQSAQKPLSELKQCIEWFPQATSQITVSQKIPLNLLKHLDAAIRIAESMLGNQGRVLVRYSGTEPKLRLLVEAPQKSLAERLLESLTTAVHIDLKESLHL